jgi:hypothetical protein
MWTFIHVTEKTENIQIATAVLKNLTDGNQTVNTKDNTARYIPVCYNMIR